MEQWQQLQPAEAAAGPRIVEPLAADMPFNADMSFNIMLSMNGTQTPVELVLRCV
jgi:hypothetical protein